jgi:hypothetical protein
VLPGLVRLMCAQCVFARAGQFIRTHAALATVHHTQTHARTQHTHTQTNQVRLMIVHNHIRPWTEELTRREMATATPLGMLQVESQVCVPKEPYKAKRALQSQKSLVEEPYYTLLTKSNLSRWSSG